MINEWFMEKTTAIELMEPVEDVNYLAEKLNMFIHLAHDTGSCTSYKTEIPIRHQIKHCMTTCNLGVE
jgi:hypothetical protein